VSIEDLEKAKAAADIDSKIIDYARETIESRLNYERIQEGIRIVRTILKGGDYAQAKQGLKELRPHLTDKSGKKYDLLNKEIADLEQDAEAAELTDSVHQAERQFAAKDYVDVGKILGDIEKRVSKLPEKHKTITESFNAISTLYTPLRGAVKIFKTASEEYVDPVKQGLDRLKSRSAPANADEVQRLLSLAKDAQSALGTLSEEKIGIQYSPLVAEVRSYLNTLTDLQQGMNEQ
jgi:hypothetical protein